MDSDSDSIIECPDTCSSQYKEALMETIKKSYDTDEFLDLQKGVCFTNRRIEKELNLRGVTKTCPSDRLAKSYLELYPGQLLTSFPLFFSLGEIIDSDVKDNFYISIYKSLNHSL